MREGYRIFRRVSYTILAIAVACISFAPNLAFGAQPLELAQDKVDRLTSGATHIAHEMYFVLPLDSEQVTPSDWVVIRMPYFTIESAPTYVSGSYGTPVFSSTLHEARITGISLLPGTGLFIGGIVASNPQSFEPNTVEFNICDDSACTQLRNQAVVSPTTLGTTATVSALVETPLSGVAVQGFTSPGAFVTLLESSSVLGTTVASPTGFFSFNLSGIPPGPHTYSMFSTDAAQRSSATTVVNVFLLASFLTTISNILLSPSLQLDKTEIDPGQTITVSGKAKPNSQVNVFVEAPLRGFTVSTNNTGDWSYTIGSTETATYTPGQYQAYTIAQDSIGTQSVTSQTLNFTVKAPADPNNPPPDCDISHGDLNCDGRTNLTDFSILIFHWQTNHRKADINSDTKVNLTDFSIQMFYFVR